jgi:dihydroorotate dehydrogenase
VALYRRLARPLLFRADPERVHDATVRAAELASRSRLARRVAAGRPWAPHPRLAIEVAGLRFRTPVGLGAGFDKSARAVPLLAGLGFGHVEVGSVSADPSGGNPRPRLFRLPAERGIVVHYGVPNDGAEPVARRLAVPRPNVPVGINVVSTNRGRQETDAEVVGDYVRAVAALQRHGDYVCLNLSCPNTRDGRGFFADLDRLRRLLDALGEAGVERPLFIKVAPFADGPGAFLDAVAPASFVSGFSVNLPPGKPPGLEHLRMPGAVSGAPAAAAAERTVAELYEHMDRDRYALIGSGGIFSAADAYRMIRLGASLVQLYTALVYEGTGVVRRITDGLAELVERDGLASIAEAVGAGA